MLKQQARLFTKLSVSIDTGIIVATWMLTHELVHARVRSSSDLIDNLWPLLILIPIMLYLIANIGLYASMRTKKHAQIIDELLKVHILGGALSTSCIYMVDPAWISRSLLFSFFILPLVSMSAAKCGIKLVLNYLRRKGYNARHLLIVQSNDTGCEFTDTVSAHSEWGLVIAGTVTMYDSMEARGSHAPDSISSGDVDALLNICKQTTIDEVIFCINRRLLPLVDSYIEPLQEMGITVRMVIDLYDAPLSRKELTMFHNEIPILTFHSKAFDLEQLFMKRCLDIIGSFIGLIITALVFPFIAIAIKCESKGPLLFGQIRVGMNGRQFRCWKFRSMFVDAEERKKELMAHNEMQGAMFKMTDDPRVTRVGRFIRKTSIDELPQFWNVLCGEMSLVGTRPPTPDEVATYENWHRKRISIKPGITGLWQVSGRSQIQDFDEVVKLDIRYVETWTFLLDIKILLKTIGVVFAGRGAS